MDSGGNSDDHHTIFEMENLLEASNINDCLEDTAHLPNDDMDVVIRNLKENHTINQSPEFFLRWTEVTTLDNFFCMTKNWMLNFVEREMREILEHARDNETVDEKILAQPSVQRMFEEIFDNILDLYMFLNKYKLQYQLFSKDTNHFWDTLYQYAAITCSLKHLQIAILEIEEGMNDVDVQNVFGQSALHLLLVCSTSESEELLDCVKLLLDAKINVNAVDMHKCSPIFIANWFGYRRVLELLHKEEGIYSDILSGSASKEDMLHQKKVRYSFELHIKEKDYTQVALLYSYLMGGKTHLFLRFYRLQLYKDEEHFGSTLLQIACKLENVRAVKRLVALGADVNKTTEFNQVSPLCLALRCQSFEIATILMKGEPKINLDKDIIFTNIEGTLSNVLKFLFFLKYRKELGITMKNLLYHYYNTFDVIFVEVLQQAEESICLEECQNLMTEMFSEDVQFAWNPKSDCISIYFNYKKVQQCWNIFRNTSYNPLFLHPLVMVYLTNLWRKYCYFYYINLLLYLVFCVALVWNFVHTLKDLELPSGSFRLMLVTAFTLLVREGFQMVVAPKEYFYSVVNWIECVTFGLPLVGSAFGPEYILKPPQVIFQIIFAALCFLVLLEKHPLFSTNIKMFQKVTKTFLKYSMVFVFLIAMFALMFFVLFYKPKETRNETCPEITFENYWVSLFYSLMMATGSFESTNLNYDRIVYSHVIVVIFVVTVSIVYINLLNALAIMDVNEIQREATINTFRSMYTYIDIIRKNAAKILGYCSVKKTRMDSFLLIKPQVINIDPMFKSKRNLRFFVMNPEDIILMKLKELKCSSNH